MRFCVTIVSTMFGYVWLVPAADSSEAKLIPIMPETRVVFVAKPI